MSSWPSLPRRLLLGLAAVGAGLAAMPRKALASSEWKGTRRTDDEAAQVWTAFFKGQRVWAYADRQSLRPGERFNIMASVGPGQPNRRVRLEVFRVSAPAPVKVWTSDFADVGYHGATATGAAIGPGWPPSFGGIDTSAWTPGCYYADFVEQTTATRDVKGVFFIILNPKRSGAVLVRLGTNTYQAYNEWGGHSLYPSDDDEGRGLMVTYDRPTPPDFWEYDIFLVTWLESLAQSLGGVDYAGNFDVHTDPTLIERYPLVITGAHDEYWSGEEYEAFHKRIFKLGRNTLFFGANTAYCQIRYGDLNRAPGAPDLGRQIVCYKGASDPIVPRAGKIDSRRLPTTYFRDGARRPETMLLGGAYQNWFEPSGPERPAYKVARTDLPYFAGTGWSVGDSAADVVGYEWDNRDPDADGKRLWDPQRSIDPAIDPARITVLFRGGAVADDKTAGLAEATLYTSPAGATVFNAAAVRWAWGLGKEGFVNAPFQRFNENLIRALSHRR